MKKLLACLLAFMLPCFALAQSYTAQVSLDVPAESLRLLIASINELSEEPLSLSEDALDALSEFLAHLSIALTIDAQTQALRLALAYGDENLVTFNGEMQSDRMLYTTSLLPNQLLELPIEVQDWTPDWEKLADALSQLDIDAFLATVDEQTDTWVDTLEHETEYGNFIGDAYAGGVISETYRFDERDTAVLTSALLWKLSERLTPALNTLDGDASAWLNTIQKIVSDAALQTPYRYLVRFVKNDEDTPIGCSLVAYAGEEQLATLSLGFGDQPLAVLGYGLNGGNIYLSLTLSDEDILMGRLWQDPARSGYAAASADESNLLLSMNAQVRENDHALILSFSGPVMGNHSDELALTAEEPNKNEALLSAAFSLDGNRLITFNLRLSENSALPPLETEGLTPIDVLHMTEADETALSSALQLGLTNYMLRFFQLLPTQLLTMLIAPSLTVN